MRRFLLLFFLTALTFPVWGQTTPEATVEAFHKALVAGDSTAVTSLLLPEAVILESGHRETREEYVGHHMKGDMRFLRAIKRTVLHRDADQTAAMAWVATISRLEGTYRNRPIRLESAELMVLKRQNGRWRIAAIHWSSRTLKD